ncbi:MAG: uridylate kinase [Hyphomicrobiaceae bacterium]|nr:uridylate kinase [Hyphomicrobiaceae bacterium]
MADRVGPALVVKLGGSLSEERRLAGIVDLIVCARYPVVVVPGGGVLADAVRGAQRDLQISDALAHRLAILSLHQMALVISARHGRFELVETIDEVAAALVAGQVPVWQPYRLQHDDATIPADWTVTSDALAARLAERMGCGQVALVKSCVIEAGLTAAAAAERGITDPVFADIVARAGLRPEFYGPGDEARLAERLWCAVGSDL